jgi:hypothetical protein
MKAKLSIIALGLILSLISACSSPVTTSGSLFGNSAQSTTSSGTGTSTLPAPVNLSAVASTTSNSIQLGWTDTSSGVTTFSIQRQSRDGGDPMVTVANVAAGVTSYNDTGLSPSWVYNYQVLAAAPGVFSAHSNIVTAQVLGSGPVATPAPTPIPNATPVPTPTQTPVNGHAALRGRVKVANGTVVAEDGTKLRMVDTYVHDFAVPYFSDINWWKNIHDIGHFNAVRVMGFLGVWSSAANAQHMDVPTLLNRLDTMVNLAAQTGMYVVIDNHSECCVSMNATNDSAFWTAVAPRYANDTNVIYELKNEPNFWDSAGLVSFENQQYNLIRSYARDTHIIAWTIEAPLSIASTIMSTFSKGIMNYSNASVGLHPYDTNGNVTGLLALYKQIQAVYPIIMTEYDPGGTIPDKTFPTTMENMGISWSFLTFGFYDLDNNKAYGDSAFLTPRRLDNYCDLKVLSLCSWLGKSSPL